MTPRTPPELMTSGQLLADLVDWAAARDWYAAEAVLRWGATPEGKELGARIPGGISLPATSILDPDPRYVDEPETMRGLGARIGADLDRSWGRAVSWLGVALCLVAILVIALTAGRPPSG